MALGSPAWLRAADAPKRLLLVTTTTGFRHGSIPTAEKVLAQLAEQSHEFTLELVQQPEGKPDQPNAPKPLKPEDGPEKQAEFAAAQEKWKAAMPAYQAAEAQWTEKLKAVFSKLSPESLKNFDGVIFANTTGDLPIPDKDAFIAWIKSGKAFIGMHSASDTCHGWPAYIEMLGGEFKGHGAQVCVECMNEDAKHPANSQLDKTWTVTQEEIYQFKNYDPTRVHELLMLAKHPATNEPGRFPVSWCRSYGNGKVFYTSLGHRNEIWDADPNIADRKNSVEVSKAFQAHILGGIEWALGLKPGDSVPQAKL
jgi:type 1 glutamine amidotransferase